MTAKIVYFGIDDFTRLRALRDAGYFVDTCSSLSELSLILSSSGRIDAIAFMEGQESAPQNVIALSRSRIDAPLILFQGWSSHANESDFDLTVPTMTPVGKWLQDIEDLIEQRRLERAKSEKLRNETRAQSRDSHIRQENSPMIGTQLQHDHERSPKDKLRNIEVVRKGSTPIAYEIGALQNLRVGAFLKSLSHEMLQELETIASISSCTPGTVLFVEGQTPQEVFFLLVGHVKLYMNSIEGKRLTVHMAGPGELLGLASAFTAAPHRASAETLYPCRVASVSCADFLKFLFIHPSASQAAARELGDLCDHTYTRLRTIGVTPSNRAKLARLLLEMSVQGKHTDRGTQIHLALKHGEIAECIGTCRESVTRILRDFQRWQVIELRGSLLTITDMSALEQCAGLK
jgi:CRP/FNR family transcriptional regulator, cyclic AMP receptor protein